MERRSFLATASAGLVSLSGCLRLTGGSATPSETPSPTPADSPSPTRTPSPTDSPTPTQSPTPIDSDGDDVPEAQDDYPDDERYSTEVLSVDDEFVIEPNRWLYWDFRLIDSGFISFEYLLRSGPERVDVYTFTADEYVAWSDGERASFIPDLSKEASVDGDLSESVDPGSYYVVFDNTNKGEWGTGVDQEVEIAVSLIAGF